MNDLILQLSASYFVKQITPKRLTVIVTNNKQLRDIEDTYDSLTLIEKFVLQSGVQGVFDYEGKKCPACGNYNYSYGDGCVNCGFDASEVDTY